MRLSRLNREKFKNLTWNNNLNNWISDGLKVRLFVDALDEVETLNLEQIL